MMVMLHAETYFHSFKVGMMPESHWQGYVKYVSGYVASPGMREFWDDVGPAFSADFSAWIDEQLENARA